MILEGIVTTLAPDGTVNIAPMGPYVAGESFDRFTLKPYRTAQTYHNLKAHPEGVFHVTDDVLVLARSAIGIEEPRPELTLAQIVRGMRLADCCRYFEFRVLELDDRGERTHIEVEVIQQGRVRDFIGFNRAKHAVVEAAILATRTAFLPLAEIQAEFRKLRALVDKTGGEQEQAAFALLEAHVARVASASKEAL